MSEIVNFASRATDLAMIGFGEVGLKVAISLLIEPDEFTNVWKFEFDESGGDIIPVFCGDAVKYKSTGEHAPEACFGTVTLNIYRY